MTAMYLYGKLQYVSILLPAEQIHQGRVCPWSHLVIGIHKGHILPTGQTETSIAGIRESAIILTADT